MTHLVVYWLDLAVGQQASQLLRVEIGHADAFGEAQLHQFLHGTPGVQVINVTVSRDLHFRVI